MILTPEEKRKINNLYGMGKASLIEQLIDDTAEAQYAKDQKHYEGMIEELHTSLNECEALVRSLEAGKVLGAKEERERMMRIVKEYGLDVASARDDILERQAKGWQALKEEE